MQSANYVILQVSMLVLCLGYYLCELMSSVVRYIIRKEGNVGYAALNCRNDFRHCGLDVGGNRDKWWQSFAIEIKVSSGICSVERFSDNEVGRAILGRMFGHQPRII